MQTKEKELALINSSAKESKIINLQEKVQKNMLWAGIINLVIGIITILSSTLIPALRGFLFIGIFSALLGIFYIHHTKKLKENAWLHLDILVTLFIINFFFGAFIPSIFIALAVYTKHQINVINGTSYIK